MVKSFFFLLLALLGVFVSCSSNDNFSDKAVKTVEIQSALEAVIKGNTDDDEVLIHYSSQIFLDAFNKIPMTPENDQFLMTTFNVFYTNAFPFYSQNPNLNFYNCFCGTILNKAPGKDLQDFHVDALEILASYLCGTVDYLIKSESLHNQILSLLFVCYSRYPLNETGKMFIHGFNKLVDLLGDVDLEFFVEHLKIAFDPEAMLIPNTWLQTDTVFMDVFEAIFEQLAISAPDVIIDPKYFTSIAPLAVDSKNVKLLSSIARILPRFESGAFTSAKNELEVFVFFCRILLPVQEAISLVEYFLDSEYFTMSVEMVSLLHFMKRPVPEEFQVNLEAFEANLGLVNDVIDRLTLFKNFQMSNNELQELYNSAQSLFRFTGPHLLPREPLSALEALQSHLIPIFKQLTFTPQSCFEASVVTFVLGFFVRADNCLSIDVEVAYIFVDAFATRLQYYFMREAKQENAATIWSYLICFKPIIKTAILKIRHHSFYNPNTLTVKLILKCFFLTQKLHVDYDSHLMDAVMLDKSSTPEMWSIVYSHMKFAYGDPNLIFAYYLFWHLNNEHDDEHIEKMSDFYHEREAISATEFEFSKLLLSIKKIH
jgi:hypothetical protein